MPETFIFQLFSPKVMLLLKRLGKKYENHPQLAQRVPHHRRND